MRSSQNDWKDTHPVGSARTVGWLVHLLEGDIVTSATAVSYSTDSYLLSPCTNSLATLNLCF